jgi:hypothetical protein
MTKRPGTSALVAALAALLCASGWAAEPPGAADAQSRYRQERAVCISGQSNQDRATCLREAGAALAEAGRRGHDGAAPYEVNATRRCESLSGADRDACTARMQGQGTTSGNAAAGGVLRELETPVKAPSAP